MEKVINALKQEKGYEQFEGLVIFTRKNGQLFASPCINVENGMATEKLIRLLNEYGDALKFVSGDMLQRVNKTKN